MKLSKRVRFGLAATAMMLFLACVAPPSQEKTPEIRLVLQITVDGLRADLLSRYEDRFGEDGFRRLIR